MKMPKKEEMPTIYPRNIEAVAKALKGQYDDFGHYNRKNPLDELLFIICSTKTDERVYRNTFQSLRKAYPTFAELRVAPEKEIARVIKPGGLSRTKAKTIKQVLDKLVQIQGKASLIHLKGLSDSECEQFLTNLPGVGIKTARCVMLYSLDRAVFPVDTHCWRMSMRLGWVPWSTDERRSAPKDMDRLQERVPKHLRYSLHVNMVSHGRAICRVHMPQCEDCSILRYCQYGKAYIVTKKHRSSEVCAGAA
jgi:endonuclease-3